ncbi:1-aminocyclopropane-1-carboxylate deaminase/D-cysteine desulfhydrase [Pseudomonas asplenii]|uniref:1-aminocyclopropane-1-carboxylate deaminase/D-cysteine desulfhydrase n=1 Tax=Pseudomonas asplenii TaxID=53407 RepID=UPI003B28D232
MRLDRIDPLISGNKWFKLSEHIAAARQTKAAGLISLGGAHSNHLHALAAAGRRFGFDTVGLLRGHPVQTPTVRDLQDFGMELHWLGYEGYRKRHEPGFWLPWQARYPRLHAVPEGGGGLAGALGCGGLPAMVEAQLPRLGWESFHGWWLAAGTGTTAAGLVLAEAGRRVVHAALAVPENHGVAPSMARILAEAGMVDSGYELIDACRGGFARVDGDLQAFIIQNERQGGVPLEPLYTGKALMALHGQVRACRFAPGTRLVFVHTGGLQGRRGFSDAASA